MGYNEGDEMWYPQSRMQMGDISISNEWRYGPEEKGYTSTYLREK